MMSKSPYVAGFELAAFVLIGLACLAFGIDVSVDYYKAKKSESWPLVSAQVIESKVERGCGRSGSYHPHIEYRYSRDGGQLSSTRIRFGDVPCGSESYATEIGAKYPIGATVKVGVNPSNMFDAVLRPGEVASANLKVFLVVVLLYIGSAFALARGVRAKGAA
jgi:hypothetical protein